MSLHGVLCRCIYINEHLKKASWYVIIQKVLRFKKRVSDLSEKNVGLVKLGVAMLLRSKF